MRAPLVARASLTFDDIVEVQGGSYSGCRLNWIGQINGWHICLNSTAVAGYVRCREVAFVRPGVGTFDPVRHDRVFYDHHVRGMRRVAEMLKLRMPETWKESV